MTGFAIRLHDVPEACGEMAVYKLDPPIESGEFVAVSAVDLGIDIPDYRSSETMIFPSDGTGVSDWGELVMVPYKSHADALVELGYEIRWGDQ